MMTVERQGMIIIHGFKMIKKVVTNETKFIYKTKIISY